MINYNGDDHGAMKFANVLDWEAREQEFLDHYLMDRPLPDWMANGIPVNMKMRSQVPIVLKGPVP